MSPDRRQKLLWWRNPVSPDKEPETGKAMLRNTVIWLGVVVVLIIIAIVLVVTL